MISKKIGTHDALGQYTGKQVVGFDTEDGALFIPVKTSEEVEEYLADFFSGFYETRLAISHEMCVLKSLTPVLCTLIFLSEVLIII